MNDDKVGAIVFGLWGLHIIGMWIVEGIKSYQEKGNLKASDFLWSLFFPLAWCLAPVAFYDTLFEITGISDKNEARRQRKAWNEYDRLKLEAKIVPNIAKKTECLYGEKYVTYHATEPSFTDPRTDPTPPELPSVHRVRQLIAQGTNRNFIDVTKKEAQKALAVYRTDAREARIAELEEELKELTA